MLMSFRFAHMSDCHLGSWSSHPELRGAPLRAFETAVDKCIQQKVDFIIIAGDLLDTSLPGVDVLRHCATQFRKCKEADIPIYLVAGSHDYSPTGKTMLSVFEEAGLINDVAKCDESGTKLFFTIDKKTGVKLTGIFGRKGSLEVESFSRLDKSIEEEKGPKIFIFHCGIDEHSAIKGMSSVPVALLPKNFDYYATGHIHIKRIYDFNNSKIAFPGPLFPTSFDELENYDSGFYIVECSDNISISWEPVNLFGTLLIEKDAMDKTPPQVENEIMETLGTRLDNVVVLIKIHGILKNGRPSDIDFKAITTRAESIGALTVKKNISKLSSKEMEEVTVDNIANIDDLERKIVAQHAGKMQLAGKKDTESLVLSLMNSLKEEKGEDETTATFEEKIKQNAKRLLKL